jgi:hypothetical protein
MMLVRLGRGIGALRSIPPNGPEAPVPQTVLALDGQEAFLAAEDGRLLNRE